MAATDANTRHFRIEIKRVRRALAQPLQTGGGHCIGVRESVLVKLTAQDDASCTGYGEAATLPWFGTESADTAAQVLTLPGNTLTVCLPTAPHARTTAPQRDTPPQHTAENDPWQDTLTQLLPQSLAAHLNSAPCARWALESALRQTGVLPPLSQQTTPTGDRQPISSPAAPFPAVSPTVPLSPASPALPCPAPSRATAVSTNSAATASAPSATTASARATTTAAVVCAETMATTQATTQAATADTVAIPVAALLPAGANSIPQPLLEAGFHVFKIKIGVRPFAEEATTVTTLLCALRQASAATAAALANTATAPRIASPAQHLKLRLDANGSLCPLSLRDWLQRLTPFAEYIDFIEQPLPVGQEIQCAAAFADSPIPFAFDESLTSLPQLRRIAEHFPQAILVVKPSLLGSAEGFLKWRYRTLPQNPLSHPSPCQPRLPEPGEATNDTHTPHRRIIYSSALETGIGLYHALGLAAADRLPPEPVGFGTGSLFAQDGLGAPPMQSACITPDCGLATFITPPPSSQSHATQNTTARQRLRAHMEALWKRA